jgi:predicted dithiol-disulfide oxidoreductase (DUF899 family)
MGKYHDKRFPGESDEYRRARDWASQRGWRNLRLLSSGSNTYNADYHAETAAGAQWPAINVFRRTAEGIFHFYNAERFYAPAEAGQHPRHADLIWPLWNLLDLTKASFLEYAQPAAMPVAKCANIGCWYQRVAALDAWRKTAPKM